MAGPYNIPLVSYNGDDPDPVEHANNFVKPAIDDLDVRVAAVEGSAGGAPARVMMYRSGDIMTPLGHNTSPSNSQLWDSSVHGCFIRLDHACRLLWARIPIEVASSVAGATIDLVIYRASTEQLVGTFGSVLVDTGGEKTATPGTPIIITEPDFYIMAYRPRTLITGAQARMYKGASLGQSSRSFDPGYPPEPTLNWSVSGVTAAPASLTTYSRSSGGPASMTPIIFAGVAP